MQGEEHADDGPRLLLVEEDRGLSVLLNEVLTEEQYHVTLALDASQGLHFGLNRDWDVIVLDRDVSTEGVDLMARLRSRGVQAPALLLTARGAASADLQVLDTGINDYLSKPFDVEELVARLPVLLSRASKRVVDLTLAEPRVVEAAGPAQVTDPSEPQDSPGVRLSPRQGVLLRTLAGQPSQVFTRDELAAEMFAGAQRPGRVDSYVHQLRRKLGPDVVVTVRGVGYRIGRF